MKSINQNKLVSFLIITCLIIVFEIPSINSKLRCEPDFKSIGDNYNCLDDPEDDTENFYGYEFAHRAGKSSEDHEYYDRWKGVYWDGDQFCYDAYDNTTRPIENIDELGDYDDYIENIKVISNLEEPPTEGSYVIIDHDETNLVNLHSKICKTKQHTLSDYNHGEYELLIKMDNEFHNKFLDTPHHFYFTVENPSDDNVTFAFKVRNFVNITENMNATLYFWGPNPEECLEEEVPETEPESPEDDDNEESSQSSESNESENDIIIVEETDAPTQEPCEREVKVLNTTFLEWTEEYPIPEVFYITNNYTIEPHSSLKINVSLTFKENTVKSTEGGYFVISEETGESDKPFYWPQLLENGKLPKLTNMELILESDLELGLSSFSLMRRRDLEEQSYLGKECHYNSIGYPINGTCGDGYVCKSDNKTCEKCKKIECKECPHNNNNKDGTCTRCFLISVEGQWNPKGGRAESLDCDLDYIDITKVQINEAKPIQVPPAIHWRVTMDFWIWISDLKPLIESKTNLNIVYKDFIAFTLKGSQDGLKIFATPIEWLYEYPTCDEQENTIKKGYYYKNYVKKYRETDTVTFLRNPVGSYDKVTMVDLVKNATSNWVYVRFAFNLDSSKQYLNDLPESNLRVPQIYTEQTGMPFHMKKFYGINNMTYLYFNNIYHPLNEELQNSDPKVNFTIYLRNLNIFREYIPQNVITKYYNLHKIVTKPSIFPQLLVSLPFSDIKRDKTQTSKNVYKMKGYSYYLRKEITGVVEDDSATEPNITEYELLLDDDVESLRPPRNFWRLNLLSEKNKQPETCDFENFIDITCDEKSDICFEDDKPLVCKDGTEERPIYLDIFNLKCQPFCELGYMHPPRYSTSKQRLYCSHFCDTGNKQCPSDDIKYTEIHTNFLCSNNFFNLYYKCFNKDESINNADFSGIFFSSFLWTPSIYIDLGKEYTEFAFDFWYYPDDRLRNFRYLDQDIPEEKEYKPKNHDKPEKEKKRIIFLSDCCKFVYGEKGMYNEMVHFYLNGNLNSRKRAEANINAYNWNHFVFTYFYARQYGGYTYYLTSRNVQYYYYGESIKIQYGYYPAPAGVILSKIIFCTFDENVNYGDEYGLFQKECKKAEWLDGFYRKLQIYDIRYSARHPIYFSHEYEDDGLNEMTKHRYIFGLSSVVDNKLIDLFAGKNGEVPWVNDVTANQNPDKTNYILYETNYSPQGGIQNWGDSQAVSDYDYDSNPPELAITRSDYNDPKCLIKQSSGYCLACKPGFSLFSKNCKGMINNDNKKAPYFYKNPGKNMPDFISLNLDFEKIKNTPYFTFFFFIKIYGFVKNVPQNSDGYIKLIIFHEERDAKGEITEEFYLAWSTQVDDGEKEKLFFFYNGRKLFSYPYYREHNFGHWVPISFAAFRENDRLFQMNMAQASILYENLPFESETKDAYTLTGKYYPYVKFTQFSILNTWVGLLSDVKVYNRFLANAWGIVRHQHETLGTAVDDVPDSAISEIDLKSETENSCLLSTQILNQPAAGYTIECVTDYNPHFYTGCGSMEAQTVRYHQGDGYRGLCDACCGTNGYALNRCLGGHDSPCGYREDNQSCETQSPVWKNWYPSGGNKIVCNIVYYIDYNRFKYAKVTNVCSPQDVWAIDFWFYTGTCHAVYKRTGGLDWGNSQKDNNNNFKEFVIEWNYHIRIRVHAEKTDDVPTHNDYDYLVDCTPIVVLEHPDLNSPEVM